jgi:hypothetical protein
LILNSAYFIFAILSGGYVISLNPINNVILPQNIHTTISQIYEASKVERLLGILADVGPDDLLIFDVDEVLISPADAFLRPVAWEHSYSVYTQAFTKPDGKFDHDLYSKWIRQVEVKPVNEKLPEAIKGFQNQGTRTIALTRMVPGAGPCGEVSAMEDFRFAELSNVGIDFSSACNFDYREFHFEAVNGRVPLYKKGIIYARPYKKDEVLPEFLRTLDFVPKKVWYIDNDKREVENLSHSMNKEGVPFVGIHYLDESLINRPYDLKVGLFQFEYFKRCSVWLNDLSAWNLIQKVESKTLA